jgi:hydrogenase maturation protease
VRRTAVACLGNRFRGDDAAGLLVGDRLRKAGIEVQECEDEPTRLLDTWAALDLLVVVDATRSGSPPGTVRRVDTSVRPLTDDVGLTSSHAFGVAETIELARALGCLPARVVVYGIEGERFAAGTDVTSSVRSAIDEVADAVREELQ